MPTTTEEARGQERRQIDKLPRDSSGRHSTRRTPREVEEQVAALTILGHSQREIGEMLGIPHTTVHGIQQRVMDEETFVQLRAQQKREWVGKAWQAVETMTLAAVKGAEKLTKDNVELTARDVRDLTVAAGIMVDKTALVLGEAGSGASGGQTREIADAVLGAWQAGREEGRREASPVNVTPGRVIDGAAEVR